MSKFNLNGNKILGVLCCRKHKYKDTEQSLRYKKTNGKPGDCVECSRTYRGKRKYPYTPNKTMSKQKARAYASLHCIYHSDCLNKAAHGVRGGSEMPCLKCKVFEELKKLKNKPNTYLKEMGVDYLFRDGSGGQVISLECGDMRT